MWWGHCQFRGFRRSCQLGGESSAFRRWIVAELTVASVQSTQRIHSIYDLRTTNPNPESRWKSRVDTWSKQHPQRTVNQIRRRWLVVAMLDGDIIFPYVVQHILAIRIESVRSHQKRLAGTGWDDVPITIINLDPRRDVCRKSSHLYNCRDTEQEFFLVWRGDKSSSWTVLLRTYSIDISAGLTPSHKLGI